jgi:hypothetical protein
MVAGVVHDRIDLHDMTLASKFVDVVYTTKLTSFSFLLQKEWHMREPESFDVRLVFMAK